MRECVLIFCEFFPPSRGGGGMWAVVNLVERLAGKYEFFVVAGNREEPNQGKRLGQEITLTKWIDRPFAKVKYFDLDKFGSQEVAKLMDELRPDLVFLNSCFSKTSRAYLWYRSVSSYPTPVILAPCGELLPNALRNKRWKKRAFLLYAKVFGKYRDLNWRASSEIEKEAIKRVVGKNVEIHVAPDLTPSVIQPDLDVDAKPPKNPGEAKLIFVARITPMKNLAFLLERLFELHGRQIDLEIAGPSEDRSYWAKCQEIIVQLPSTVRVTYSGSLSNQEVLDRMAASHFYILPTLTENFGYTVIEALACGTPVVLSDCTPWNSVAGSGAGFTISLDDADEWSRTLKDIVDADHERYLAMSKRARAFANAWLNDPRNVEATLGLFAHALGKVSVETKTA